MQSYSAGTGLVPATPIILSSYKCWAHRDHGTIIQNTTRMKVAQQDAETCLQDDSQDTNCFLAR